MYREWLIPLIQIADAVVNEGIIFYDIPDACDLLMHIAEQSGMNMDDEIVGHTIIDHLTKDV